MYTRLRVQNYRCFRELEVELRPLTVAIGRNNTGKTTFLEALLGASQAGPDGLTTDNPTHRHRNGPGIARAQLRPENQLFGQQVVALHLPAAGPSMICDGSDDNNGVPRLTKAGENVPAVVDWLLRRDRARFDGFVAAVRSLVPGVQDLQVTTPTSNQRSLQLVLEGGLQMPADEASAGTRILLAFLALAWHPEPPKLVLVEEPENGLHPERLAEVMALLRGLVTGEHAPGRAQVVLTTHSPYLLSCVKFPEDQVLVFRRDPDGACAADPVDLDRIRDFQPDFGLGEIWSNLGEAELVRR